MRSVGANTHVRAQHRQGPSGILSNSMPSISCHLPRRPQCRLLERPGQPSRKRRSGDPLKARTSRGAPPTKPRRLVPRPQPCKGLRAPDRRLPGPRRAKSSRRMGDMKKRRQAHKEARRHPRCKAVGCVQPRRLKRGRGLRAPATAGHADGRGPAAGRLGPESEKAAYPEGPAASSHGGET